MEKLEDEVASALTNRSTGTDGLLQLLMELERRVETGGVCEDIGVVKKLLNAFDDFMGRARPVFSRGKPLSLDPVLHECLTCLIDIAMSSSEAHEYIREETCAMERLTSLLNDDYEMQHKKQMLKTIEVLSRRLKIVWSAPYLTSLIKNLFKILVVPHQTPEIFLFCLRIVTNLVSNGSCYCLNIVARDEHYRDVMKILVDIMASKTSDKELLVQVTHLGYLIESSVDVKAKLLAKHVKDALEVIAKKFGFKIGNQYKHSLASSVYYMSQCVNTILTRIGKEHEDEFTKLDGASSQNDNRNIDRGRLDLNHFVKKVGVYVIPDFLIEPSFLETENPQLMVESLLGLVKAMFPHFIPVGAYDSDVLESVLKLVDTLASITKPKSNSHLVVLQTYNHFVERLLTASTRNLADEVFHNAFKSCQIVPASTSKDLVRNVASIRLFTNMVAFNKVNKRYLKEDNLVKLFECLLVEKPEPFQPPSLLISMCLVEALNALSTTSKCPTVLMESIQQEETLIHISNCIVNGDVALVGMGLSLTGAVGFTQKCQNRLSKIMVDMRDSSPKYGATSSTIEFSNIVSDKARLDMKRLNKNLEMFMQTDDGNNYTVDDILSWLKMKNDMHEVEIASMRDQIFQLQRTSEQFKDLIKRQGELLTTACPLKKDIRDIQQMLESMKQKKIELEIKHANWTDIKRKQLNFNERLYKAKSERLVQLQKEMIALRENIKRLEAPKTESAQSDSEITAENAKLLKKVEELESETKTSKHRIVLLEKDLKKSEESRKATEGLLEAERRKTEIIQQVLGNRQ